MRAAGIAPGVRRTIVLAIAALGLGACAATTPPTDPPAIPEAAPGAHDTMLAASPPAAAPAAPTPAAPEPALRETAPTQYVVREGDTLWDIANVFLRDPWHWAEIWLMNRQVRNPHLIYPGDVLTLYFAEGPDGAADRPTVTVDLGPRIRIEALEDKPQPIAALEPFLVPVRVVDEATLDEAPYIVAAQDDRRLFGTDDSVYVRNAPHAEQYDLYQLVRRDRSVADPVTGEKLGVTTLPIGEAEIVRGGEIATAVIRNNQREARRGDRLIGFDDKLERLFAISSPPPGLEGQVVLLFDAISQIGRYQIAVINRGEREGVANGQVFSLWESGRTARDPVTSGRRADTVMLPDEEIGALMVFRTFEKLAYGLVIESARPIREGYRVQHPDS